MPFETSEFDLLTSEWITITNAMAADGKALTAAAKPSELRNYDRFAFILAVFFKPNPNYKY